MKGVFVISTAAALGLASASPAIEAAQAACNADNCARAVTGVSRTAHLAGCSSFLSYTVEPSYPTVVTTVRPTATRTVYTTATVFFTFTTGTIWPTTINTEVYPSSRATNVQREAERCAVASTVRPTDLPVYARQACSASARFSSACACAGVKPRTTTLPCSTVRSTVTTGSPKVVTQTATITQYGTKIVPAATQTTALVNTIRCGDTVPIDEDLPAYKIVCEAEGTGNRQLLETVQNTDWDNCVSEATFGRSADDWEFDLVRNTCYIYDPYGPNENHNATRPRSNYVYAYVLHGQNGGSR